LSEDVRYATWRYIPDPRLVLLPSQTIQFSHFISPWIKGACYTRLILMHIKVTQGR
jgi:hypothetical protein